MSLRAGLPQADGCSPRTRLPRIRPPPFQTPLTLPRRTNRTLRTPTVASQISACEGNLQSLPRTLPDVAPADRHHVLGVSALSTAALDRQHLEAQGGSIPGAPAGPRRHP